MQQIPVPRVPTAWLHLRPGESMHSKLPLHRLESLRDRLGVLGVSVVFSPSPTGYYVECVARAETKNEEDA